MQGSSDSALQLLQQAELHAVTSADRRHMVLPTGRQNHLTNLLVLSLGSEEGTGVGGMGESNPGVGSSTWQGNVCITFASQTSVTSKLYLQGIPA